MRLGRLKEKLHLGHSKPKPNPAASNEAHAAVPSQGQLSTPSTSHAATNAKLVEPTSGGSANPRISDVPIRELWNAAYEKLREEDDKLVQQYEDALHGDLASGLGSALGVGVSRREKMGGILKLKIDEVKRNTWKLKFGSSEVPVRDLADPVIGIIDWADDYITDAVSGNAYASIAWSGVSLLLPLLLNPSKQAASLASGLKYIASLIVQSRMWEDLYARRYEARKGAQDSPPVSHAEYRSALEALYCSILKYQVTAYCYYAKHSAFRVGLDMVKWDDWVGLVDDVREQERVFAAVSTVWRDMKYDEECEAAERRHRGSIGRWDALSLDVQGLRKAVEDAQADGKRRKLLQWLSDVDPSVSYNVAREKHESGTGEWLLRENQKFRTWQESPGSLLWLHGKAGSGKSVLSSSVIKYLRDRHSADPETALAYFYFTFTDSKKQNVLGMLSSLVKQLCSRRPDTPQPIADLASYQMRGERPDIETLEVALVATMRGFSAVHIVIDGLDECPTLADARQELLNSLCRIVAAAPVSAHILCTSRKEADIEASLNDLLTPPAISSLDLSVHRDRLNRDITVYINSTLASHRYRSWPDSVKDEVRDALIAKADGMFQYVACQFDELRRFPSVAAVRKALQTLPAGLDATYDRMLRSIDDEFQQPVLNLLKWLCFADRPLILEELAEIFVLHPYEPVLLDKSERLFNTEEVLRYLGAFVVLDVNGEDEDEYEDDPGSDNNHDDGSEDDLEPNDEHDQDDSDHEHDSVHEHENQHKHDSDPEHDSDHVPDDDLEPDNDRDQEEPEDSDHDHDIQDHDHDGRDEDPYNHYANGRYEDRVVNFGRVSLAHYSIKEYLMSTRGARLRAAAVAFSEEDAHLHIVHTCLRYLCEVLATDELSDWDDLRQQHPLYSYACTRWMPHLEIVPPKLWPAEMVQAVRRALAPRSRSYLLATISVARHHGEAQWGSAPPFFFTASCGFRHLTDMLISTTEYLTQDDLDAALQWAAMAGETDLVRSLLDHGADVNGEAAPHGSALHAAVTTSHGEVVRVLLDRGADANAWREKHGSVLQVAAKYGQLHHVEKLLVAHGAHGCSEQKCVVSPAARFWWSSSYILDFLFLADRNCKHDGVLHKTIAMANEAQINLSGIQTWLDRGADVNGWGGEEYGYPLHLACRLGDLDIVELLLRNGADIHAVDPTHGSVLQAACVFGSRVDVVELLLKKTVDGLDVNAQGGLHGNALQAACSSSDPLAVRMLLDHGADVNASGGFYGSALQAAAAQSPNAKVVRLLLERGADVNKLGGQFGTALQAAALVNDCDTVKLLLNHGADVNAQAGKYGTALQAAASQSAGLWDDDSRPSTLRLLLNCGADLHIEGGEYGTALQAACASTSTEDHYYDPGSPCRHWSSDDHHQRSWVARLIELGADVHFQGGGFGSAWHAAANAAVHYLCWQPRLQLLLDQGVDINDPRGRLPHAPTALHAVLNNDCLRDPLQKLEFLLDRGADPNLSAGTYGFPLQAACAADYAPHKDNVSETKVQMLLDCCPTIDVNAQGGLFGCALQAAAYSGQAKSVKRLLEKGATVNTRGGKYGSALNAAVVRGYWDIVEVLLAAGAEPDCFRLTEPDQEWLGRVREEHGRGGVERYLKFWEVEDGKRKK